MHAQSNKALITVNDFNALLEKQNPFAQSLGVEVLEIGCGSATLRLPDNSTHQRVGGIVAGPMLMALADVALYAAVVGATGEPRAVTASLSINFLRAAPPGGVLALASLHKVGRLVTGEAKLFSDAGDDMIAHVISSWSVPRGVAGEGRHLA